MSTQKQSNRQPQHVYNRRRAIVAGGVAAAAASVGLGINALVDDGPKDPSCEITVGKDNNFTTEEQIGTTLGADNGMKHTNEKGDPITYAMNRSVDSDGYAVVHEGDRFTAENVNPAVCRQNGGMVLDVAGVTVVSNPPK